MKYKFLFFYFRERERWMIKRNEKLQGTININSGSKLQNEERKE